MPSISLPQVKTDSVPPRPPSYSSSVGVQIPFPQRTMQPRSDSPRVLHMFYMGSIVILLLCSLSCMVALYRNTIIMEQNLALLEKQILIQAKCESLRNVPAPIFSRMRREVNMDECPPCETPPVNPIEPYRNPVSVLNEDPRVGKKANYAVQLICKNPPISRAVLTIKDDPAFAGKEWIGRGDSKQAAKQSAAWNAIQTQFPDLKQEVAEEYIPPVYNPPCSG